MNEKTGLDGKWVSAVELVHGVFKVIIKGNTYVSFYNGWRYGKGTIIYDNENFTLTSTHARCRFFWTRFVEVVEGKYVKENAKATVSGIEGRYADYNGTWVCSKK